jgi:hypothetical protein
VSILQKLARRSSAVQAGELAGNLASTLSSPALPLAELTAPSRKAFGWMLFHPVGKLRCSHHTGLHRDVSEVRRRDGLLAAIRRRGQAAEDGDNLDHGKILFLLDRETSPLSMRLAEHEREGHNEELIALIVADMQDPVTPILKRALIGERLHDAGRVIVRLSKIVHHGAAAIDENVLGVGAMEIDLGHVQPPSNGTRSREISVFLLFPAAWQEKRKR